MADRRDPRQKAERLAARGETREQRLARAKGYPYKRPPTSFIFLNGEVLTFDNAAWRGIPQMDRLDVHAADGTMHNLGDVCRRHGIDLGCIENAGSWMPILAIGSNAGPEQLARKFPRQLFPDGVIIPVIQAVLEDFDVVYAPLLSSYGSCTATLEHSPGTRTSMFITYLLEPFALRMHQTEGTYNLVRLNNVRLHVGLSLQQHQSGQQALETVSSIYQYNHQTGTLHVPLAAGDGAAAEAKPIAIAEIEAADRRFPALRQPAMLHLLKHALAHARGRAQHGGSAGGAGGGGQPVGLRHVHVEHHSLSSSGVSAQHPTALTPAAASHPAAAPPAVAVNGEALHDHDHAALDEWVLSYLDDGWLRAACIEHLSASSREFSYDSYDVEMSLGDIFSASVR